MRYADEMEEDVALDIFRKAVEETCSEKEAKTGDEDAGVGAQQQADQKRDRESPQAVAAEQERSDDQH